MTPATIADMKKKIQNLKKRKNVEEGASTSVWAGIFIFFHSFKFWFSFFIFNYSKKPVAPELEDKSGLYLENCSISVEKETTAQVYEVMAGHLKYALNPESAEKLWILSEQIVAEASA